MWFVLHRICTQIDTYIKTQLHVYILVHTMVRRNTIGQFLIVWFNDYVFGKSNQITNPIIAMVNPVLYYSIYYARVYVCESIKCARTKSSQFVIKKLSYSNGLYI